MHQTWGIVDSEIHYPPWESTILQIFVAFTIHNVSFVAKQWSITLLNTFLLIYFNLRSLVPPLHFPYLHADFIDVNIVRNLNILVTMIVQSFLLTQHADKWEDSPQHNQIKLSYIIGGFRLRSILKGHSKDGQLEQSELDHTAECLHILT